MANQILKYLIRGWHFRDGFHIMEDISVQVDLNLSLLCLWVHCPSLSLAPNLAVVEVSV